MEQGSLIQEALQRMQEQRNGSGGELLLQNTLMVNVFVLDTTDRIALFQQLARLANHLNTFIQSTAWPWHAGGEGLVFGVHSTCNSSGQAHLRATCRYGECIQDEWFAIALVLHLSSIHKNVAVECWDLDDGQVLLVESANVLPPWIHDFEPESCRHRCWIRQGKIVLIKGEQVNSGVSQSKALELLKSSNEECESPPEVQRAIHNRTCDFGNYLEQATRNNVSTHLGNYLHRAPLVVPRRIATLMQQRPELVPCAVLAYCRSVDNHKQYSLGQVAFSDLVWTSHTMQKTTYAMLRTISHDTVIPKEYRSVEANRMKRACQVESTPHLRYALQNGIRITIGFELLLQQQQDDAPRQEAGSTTKEAHIVQHWSRIDIECGGDGQWLVQAWQAGPNRSSHDLTDLITCPVYEPQVVNSACPISHPNVSLRDQIKSQLNNKGSGTVFDTAPPRPQDVDSDEWLEFKNVQEMDDLIMETATKTTTASNDSVTEAEPMATQPDTKQQETGRDTEMEALNTMLDSFQTFVGEKSDIKGVSHDENKKNDISMEESLEPVEINPRVFMNLLHTVLKSSPEEIASFSYATTSLGVHQDPYFSKEDYDLLAEEESSDDDEGDMDGHEEEDTTSMKAVMRAMDDELRGTEASLALDNAGGEEATGDNADEDITMNTHVLSNLLSSLDASGGGPGPVHNILTEMGVDPLKLPNEEAEESHDSV